MKNINDYKGTKTAIHCKTQEEWNWVTNKLKVKGVNITFDIAYPLLDTEEGCYSLDYAANNGYAIIPASDFMPTNRIIEQIETELEGLRNELELLKAEAQTPKKKPIEFVKYLDTEDLQFEKPSHKAENFINVKLLHKGVGNELDLIKAWVNNEHNAIIYLGHWNDGIK